MRSRDIEERLARIEDRMATRDDVAEILAAIGRRRTPRRYAATLLWAAAVLGVLALLAALLRWPGILT